MYISRKYYILTLCHFSREDVETINFLSLVHLIESLVLPILWNINHLMLFLPDNSGIMLVARNSFWTMLFTRHFVEAPDDSQKDDLLFYVRKTTARSKYNIPQVYVYLWLLIKYKLCEIYIFKRLKPRPAPGWVREIMHWGQLFRTPRDAVLTQDHDKQ